MGTDNFSDSRDIYLELLLEAQKIEDRKLVQLIRSRLREFSQMSSPTNYGCQIIPFPGVCVATVTPPPSSLHESAPFWPRFSLRHIGLFISGYVTVLFLAN